MPREVWGPDNHKSRWERKRSQAGQGGHRPVTPGQVRGTDREQLRTRVVPVGSWCLWGPGLQPPQPQKGRLGLLRGLS